jgi:hypothetical protein
MEVILFIVKWYLVLLVAAVVLMILLGILYLVLLVSIYWVAMIWSALYPNTEWTGLPERTRRGRGKGCGSSDPLVFLGLGFLLGWWSNSDDS